MRITIYQGNTKAIVATVLNPDGSSKDLSGFSANFLVKQNRNSPDPAIMDVASTSIIGNSILFELTNADTTIPSGDYYYEIVIANVGNVEVRTIAQNRFRVLESLKF